MATEILSKTTSEVKRPIKSNGHIAYELWKVSGGAAQQISPGGWQFKIVLF